MFKLLYNCTDFTYQQCNSQNPSSQALTVCERRTSRHSSWVQKRQRSQRSNCQHPLDHGKSKIIFFKVCFIDYAKSFDCVYQNKLWKIVKEMGIPDHLTYLLRNLYAGQEATVRTRHGTMDWFQIGKGVHQSCVSPDCLFNLYTEHIMQNARLDEVQAGIKSAGRNINNLRYTDSATITLESKEEQKSLLMKVKEKSKKAGLNPTFRK